MASVLESGNTHRARGNVCLWHLEVVNFLARSQLSNQMKIPLIKRELVGELLVSECVVSSPILPEINIQRIEEIL